MNEMVWLRYKGKDYNRVLVKLHLIGINLLEIKVQDNYLYIKVYKNDVEKINKYYKFKIYKKTGFNLLMDKIKHNWIFMIALIGGALLFLILNNMIVKVRVIHENKEIRELLETELEEYGLKIPCFKKSYKKLDKIKQEILDKYPDKLDWMEFEVTGMVLNVRVEERIITDIKKDDKVCNLVATKDGMINNLKVFKGEAKVGLNDYVRKGDILISGIIMYNDSIKNYVCASGEVYAKAWYTVSVSIPLRVEEIEETGKKKYNIIYENNEIKKEVLKKRFNNYNSKLKNVLQIFDFNLYLETEYEVKKVVREIGEEEAIKLGMEKAVNSINIKNKEKSMIIDKKVLKKSINNSKMDIDVFIATSELISTEVEVRLESGIDGNVSKYN